jgi:putative endonuclease
MASRRAPSHGKPFSCFPADDDGIVVDVPFTYILRCAGDYLYVGATEDLQERLAKHNEGTGSARTASRRPLTLAYAEEQPTLEHAYRRERQIKGWTRAKKEALIANNRALGESRIAGLRDLCCARFSRYAVPLPFLVSFECGG